jgi:hypothetical protein
VALSVARFCTPAVELGQPGGVPIRIRRPWNTGQKLRGDLDPFVLRKGEGGAKEVLGGTRHHLIIEQVVDDMKWACLLPLSLTRAALCGRWNNSGGETRTVGSGDRPGCGACRE